MNPQSDDANRNEERDSGEKAGPVAGPLVRFEELAQGNREVLIQFQDQQYRLRVTRNGKLILNK